MWPGLTSPEEFRARLRMSEHDSVLGRWQDLHCTPHPALAGMVQALWIGRGRTAYRRSRLLPSVATFLVINLGPAQYIVARDGAALHRCEDAWFCGQQSRYLEYESTDGTAMLGVVFAPTAAYRLLHESQRELADRVVDVASVLGARVGGLRERLLDQCDDASRLALIEAWLFARLAHGREIHPAVAWAADALAESNGQARIGWLAREAGLSRKHLHARFVDAFGLAPKTLARIHRFQHALHGLRSRAWPLAHLAADCGYFDAAHMVRDFVDFGGLTPTDLLRADSPDPVTVALW